MGLKLRLVKSHLSIVDFPSVELPDFTVITGLNGSGKTHLLQAIESGSIVAEGIDKSELRLFSDADLKLQNAPAFSGHILVEERRSVYADLSTQRTKYGEDVLNRAREAGIPSSMLAHIEQVASLTKDDLRALGDPVNDPGLASRYASLTAEIGRLSARIIERMNAAHRPEAQRVATSSAKPIAALTEEDFSLFAHPSWGSTTIFQQDFGRVFVQYNELLKANRLRRDAAANGTSGLAYLSEDEFRTVNNPPPWEFVNHALQDAGLGFEINRPHPFELRPFTPRLTKLGSGVEVPFGQLSSGERVLMSFALVLYQALDERQFAKYPKLLLLDEVDAPLHPSMCRHLIDAIKLTLVGRHKIAVVATTHSPSMAALVPEDSLYCMSANTPGLRKIGKARALNILTAGVPTLAISHHGRRQVFVESPSDAERYNDLFQLLKATLDTEQSLDFISTGSRNTHDRIDKNTGREAVKRIVAALVECGNQSVFGLIDWDTTAVGSNRVFVLAPGRRYSIENVLLDPLLVLGLILKDHRAQAITARKLPRSSQVTYGQFLNLSREELQPMTSELQALVLQNCSSGDLVECTYESGFTLEVDQQYLVMNGHHLQDRITSLFPELRVHGNTEAALLGAIISNVVRDKQGFLPMEVRLAFSAILSQPIHLEPVEVGVTALT